MKSWTSPRSSSRISPQAEVAEAAPAVESMAEEETVGVEVAGAVVPEAVDGTEFSQAESLSVHTSRLRNDKARRIMVCERS